MNALRHCPRASCRKAITRKPSESLGQFARRIFCSAACSIAEQKARSWTERDRVSHRPRGKRSDRPADSFEVDSIADREEMNA